MVINSQQNKFLCPCFENDFSSPGPVITCQPTIQRFYMMWMNLPLSSVIFLIIYKFPNVPGFLPQGKPNMKLRARFIGSDFPKQHTSRT